MRTNLIKTLLLSAILVVTSVALLSVQAQTRPRRVSPIPKNDSATLSETQSRQVKASEAVKENPQHSRSSRATINQARDFLDHLHRLIESYLQDSRYGPPY
jgi:hypothetical protein